MNLEELQEELKKRLGLLKSMLDEWGDIPLAQCTRADEARDLDRQQMKWIDKLAAAIDTLNELI